METRGGFRILIRGAQWSFDPSCGGPWAQHLLKIGGYPLKLPKNCMIWTMWGQDRTEIDWFVFRRVRGHKITKTRHALSFDNCPKCFSAQKDFSDSCTPYVLRRKSIPIIHGCSDISYSEESWKFIMRTIPKFHMKNRNYSDSSWFRFFIQHRALLPQIFFKIMQSSGSANGKRKLKRLMRVPISAKLISFQFDRQMSMQMLTLSEQRRSRESLMSHQFGKKIGTWVFWGGWGVPSPLTPRRSAFRRFWSFLVRCLRGLHTPAYSHPTHTQLFWNTTIPVNKYASSVLRPSTPYRPSREHHHMTLLRQARPGGLAWCRVLKGAR